MRQFPECNALLSTFLLRLGVSDNELADASAVEFETENLLVRIYPHLERPTLIMDVVILGIDPGNEQSLGGQRLDTLHRLNALARTTHGAVISLSPTDELLITRILDLRSADIDDMLDGFNDLIERGRSLREGWQHLGNLLQNETPLTRDQGHRGFLPPLA